MSWQCSWLQQKVTLKRPRKRKKEPFFKNINWRTSFNLSEKNSIWPSEFMNKNYGKFLALNDHSRTKGLVNLWFLGLQRKVRTRLCKRPFMSSHFLQINRWQQHWKISESSTKKVWEEWKERLKKATRRRLLIWMPSLKGKRSSQSRREMKPARLKLFKLRRIPN